MIRDVLHRARHEQVPVARQVPGGDDLVTCVVRVVQREVSAPLVERVPELRTSRQRLQLVRVRPEAHAAPACVDRRVRPRGKLDGAPAIAELLLEDDRLGGALVRQIDPVVNPVDGSVHGVLRVGERESGQHHLPDVRATVAIGVFEIQHVRGGGDQHAPLPAHDAGRQHQVVRKDAAAIDPAIPVRVLEQLDAARGTRVERITGHFDDEETAVLVDVHCNRAGDHRLGCDHVDVEPLGDLHGRERLRRRQWRSTRTHPDGAHEKAGVERGGEDDRGG